MTRSIPLASDLDWPDLDIEVLSAFVRRRLSAVVAGDRLSPPENIYRGQPATLHGDSVVAVGPAGAEPTRLLHVVSHSPAGFSWGYGGSGPADLSLSILHHALVRAMATGEAHPSVTAVVDGMMVTDEQALAAQAAAWRMHHDFKFEIVAGWDQHTEWRIEERAVLAFVLEHLS